MSVVVALVAVLRMRWVQGKSEEHPSSFPQVTHLYTHRSHLCGLTAFTAFSRRRQTRVTDQNTYPANEQTANRLFVLHSTYLSFAIPVYVFRTVWVHRIRSDQCSDLYAN